MWIAVGVLDGLVTRDWLPKERVAWAAAAARRRGGMVGVECGVGCDWAGYLELSSKNVLRFEESGGEGESGWISGGVG